MRWHTVFERQEAAQERQPLLAIECDFDPAIGATDHGAQTQQQDFLQRNRAPWPAGAGRPSRRNLPRTRSGDRNLRSSPCSSQNDTGLLWKTIPIRPCLSPPKFSRLPCRSKSPRLPLLNIVIIIRSGSMQYTSAILLRCPITSVIGRLSPKRR